MSQMNKELKEHTPEFITREDLKDYIHNIHNFLRNSGIGYGQTAMKVFSIFYGLKLIENDINTLEIPDDKKDLLKFNNIYNFVIKSGNRLGITEHIQKVLDYLYELRESDIISKANYGYYIYYNIPVDIKDEVLKELILDCVNHLATTKKPITTIGSKSAEKVKTNRSK